MINAPTSTSRRPPLTAKEVRKAVVLLFFEVFEGSIADIAAGSLLFLVADALGRWPSYWRGTQVRMCERMNERTYMYRIGIDCKKRRWNNRDEGKRSCQVDPMRLGLQCAQSTIDHGNATHKPTYIVLGWYHDNCKYVCKLEQSQSLYILILTYINTPPPFNSDADHDAYYLASSSFS